MHDRLDEVFEARAALILAMRGYAATLIAGLLWHLQIASRLIEAVCAIAAGLCVLVALAALAPAALAVRNILGRRLGLHGRPALVAVLGVLLLGLLLAVGVLIFQLPGSFL